MDRIDLAERRFHQIVPDPTPTLTPAKKRQLVTWLQDDVVPVVAEHIGRPKFRDRAAWPVRTFRCGDSGEVRRQVDDLSAAIVRHARQLRSAIRTRRVETALRRLGPVRSVATETVEIRSGTVRRLSRTLRESDRVDRLAGQLEALSRPYWRDLATPDDYFRPSNGWLLRDGGGPSEAGDLVLSLNPELHAIGDFVTRALLRRTTILVEMLTESRTEITNAVRAAGIEPPKTLAEAWQDAPRLDDSLRQLRTAVWPDREGPVRDSCIVLTQIYAAFHPDPDLAWLGLPQQTVEVGRFRLHHDAVRMKTPELVERVAAALGDLRRLYDGDPPGRSALEEAIARGGLVLSLSPAAAYWDGQAITAEWEQRRRLWELLVALARCGQGGLAVLEVDIFPDEVSDTAMSSRMSRLKALLPPTLKKVVIPGLEPHSYRLDLDAAKIMIVDPAS